MSVILAALSVRSILDSLHNVYFLHICLDLSYPQWYVCIVNRLAVNVSSFTTLRIPDLTKSLSPYEFGLYLRLKADILGA